MRRELVLIIKQRGETVILSVRPRRLLRRAIAKVRTALCR